MALLLAGFYYGEVALLNGRPRSAWVMARSYCVLAVLQKDDLDIITEDHPEMLTALFQRMQQVCNVTASITLDELRERFIAKFRSVEEAFGRMDLDNRGAVS